MVAYIDLMAVTHIGISMMCIRFLNEVDVYRIKGSGRLKYIFLTLPLILLIYVKLWLSIVVIILTYLVIFILDFKKHFMRPFIEYLICYYFLSFLMVSLSPYVAFRNFLVVVTAPYGFFALAVIPVFYLLFTIVYKVVDSIYHLKNYRVDGIILVNGKKAKVRCYFDSGNTLRYQGIPVIFFLKDNYPFEVKASDNIVEYKTLNESRTIDLQEGMICFTNGSYQMVYIALSDKDDSFCGCECLLNAYLGW